MFSYEDRAEELSPFLLLDYSGPRNFPPTDRKLGVGEHPHRGFETVTIVYDGEVEHRDSSGGGGKIGPGEVQWMTAGAGVVHEEFHGRDFARRGGRFEMVQLWVNLPRKEKLVPAAYQAITKDRIPEVPLPDGAGTARVIAGAYEGKRGPARTHSPMNVWDVRLRAGHTAVFKVAEGHTAAVFVLSGRLRLAGGEAVTEAELAAFERDGDRFALEADADSVCLVLTGEPLNEPIVGYGPFVMSTQAEIRQAIHDFQSGLMGHLK
jgi:redox-sensitive bicupin YhaK (pirin superfamily)